MTIERDPKKVNYLKDGQYKLYPDEPLSRDNHKEFLAREESQYFDPCKEAAKMSMACLDRNDYDRSKCKLYFESYRDCLKAWRNRR